MSCPLCPTQAEVLRSPNNAVWPPMPVVCRSHATRAVLPNGEPLAAFHSASWEPGDDALGYVLNPLKLVPDKPRQGWASWSRSGCEVNWSQWHCRNYFEFEATHRSELLDVLVQLDAHRADLSAADGRQALLTFGQKLGVHALDSLVRLARRMRRQELCSEALLSQGIAFPQSMDQARSMLRDVELKLAVDETLSEVAARLPALLALAQYRLMLTEQRWAVEFETASSTEEIADNPATSFSWKRSQREKDRDDYLTCTPIPGLTLRLYERDFGAGTANRYCLEIQRRAPCCMERADVHRWLAELLSCVGAVHVTPSQFRSH